MKVISERISILKKENILSIVILPGLDKKRLAIIFFWILAWSVCGVIVFINYFKETKADLKLFMLIYLSFWTYFEFSIIRAFRWKRSGKEKLWIREGILHYQRELNGRGKIEEYHLDLISKLQVLELKHSRLADTLNQSFWVKGGERLQFMAQSKKVLLGMQLNDEEASIVQKEVNSFIP
ncbi:MAG: hypothetical protein PSX36_10800 [bacterium]|nr:hypothetical protein [bacterium]